MNDYPYNPENGGNRPPSNNPDGKLILGGNSNRGSYQNPNQPGQRPPHQGGQPGQGQNYPQQGQYPVPPYQGQPPSQGQSPYPGQSPMPGQQGYYQQNNMGPSGTPGFAPPRRGARRRNYRLMGCLTGLALLCILGILFVTAVQKASAFGSAISNQAPFSTQTGYMNTSDRVNILVMGFGGTGHDGAYLTDSMVVMSIIPSTQHTTLISVPRDLWVQVPSGSGNYSKINSTYSVASNNGQDPIAGGDAAAKKVSQIIGLNVQYWMTINFAGFRDLINTIGGIDVNVPRTFSSLYPKNDDPAIDAGWKTVKFTKGMAHMNGETAIEYSRARHSADPVEGTDFARSARQMIVIKATLSKVKQPTTWPSLLNATSVLQHTIFTDLSLADLAQFSLKMNLNTAHRVGLSDQNVLEDQVAGGGQDILTARNGDWQGIITYVQQNLYN